MKKSLVLAVLFGTVVYAQPTTSYTFNIYNTGASSPLSSTVIQAANVQCNQTPPTSTNTVNPTNFSFDDPDNAGKSCIWTDPGNGPLFSTPFGGNYQGALIRTNSAGSSGESNRAPFTKPGTVPSALAGFKLYR